MRKGNGDATLTQFGASVTPNHHALANTFGLFDNFYDEGTLSADGHNWLMQADANDYVEKEFGAFYRSYPAQGGDALAYQRDGFLWNAVQAAGQVGAQLRGVHQLLHRPTATRPPDLGRLVPGLPDPGGQGHRPAAGADRQVPQLRRHRRR